MRLNFFRELLGGGFHNHVKENELVQAIFDLRLDEGEGKRIMGHTEKRLTMSKNSRSAKQRSKDRRRDRGMKVTGP